MKIINNFIKSIISKNCEHCNKEFQTNHKLKKYCDMTCGEKAKAEKGYAKKREATRLKKLNKNSKLIKL